MIFLKFLEMDLDLQKFVKFKMVSNGEQITINIINTTSYQERTLWHLLSTVDDSDGMSHSLQRQVLAREGQILVVNHLDIDVLVFGIGYRDNQGCWAGLGGVDGKLRPFVDHVSFLFQTRSVSCDLCEKNDERYNGMIEKGNWLPLIM